MIVSNRLERGIRSSMRRPPRIRNDTTVATLSAAGMSTSGLQDSTASAAMKLSTVDRCIEVLSDSLGKLPIYVMERDTRKRVPNHPLNEILGVRPNEAQTPTVCKKMMEANRNCGGNGYALIIRSPTSLAPEAIIPVPFELVRPWLDTSGKLWYSVIHPFTGTPMTVHREDMIHLMAYTHNGYKGISVLTRASEVISAGRAAQQYNLSYYANGGQPSGILTTTGHLGGYEEIKKADGTVERVDRRDIIRNEWAANHAGPTNAQKIAVLDSDLKYQPISISNKDAQFVEQSELSVQDIARFFGIPLYKLQSGKQSYNSNEQNAIEYVVSTLHPIVTQWEEELTWKLLPANEATKLKIRINMMAELRGDFSSRATWYKAMREIGGYSINDILALEDLPDVEGGDERYASLNYVPASLWRELSIKRNNGGAK